MRGDWAVAREGAIFMSNADYITIQNSTFTNLGGNGIFMSAHNRTNIVNNNSFVNMARLRWRRATVSNCSMPKVTAARLQM